MIHVGQLQSNPMAINVCMQSASADSFLLLTLWLSKLIQIMWAVHVGSSVILVGTRQEAIFRKPDLSALLLLENQILQWKERMSVSEMNLVTTEGRDCVLWVAFGPLPCIWVSTSWIKPRLESPSRRESNVLLEAAQFPYSVFTYFNEHISDWYTSCGK